MPQLTESFGGRAWYIYLKFKILGQKEEMWMRIIRKSIMLIVIHTESYNWVFTWSTTDLYTGSLTDDQCGHINFNKLSRMDYWEICAELSSVHCDCIELRTWPLQGISHTTYVNLKLSKILCSMTPPTHTDAHTRARLRWSSMLSFGTQVRGFKPGRSRWIFKGKKILSTPSEGK
jgi:hypothetical protein